MKKIAYILAALMTASCVYPYTPEMPQNEAGRLVVEGDILVGKVCTFEFSFVNSFGNGEESQPAPITEVWVEDGEGKKFSGKRVDGNSGHDPVKYSADLTEASQDGIYSLKFKDRSGTLYYSAPAPVEKGCEIDGMAHYFDDENMYITISLSGLKGNKYRILWNEDWEYKAQFLATSKYLPPSKFLPEKFRKTGMMEPLPFAENVYYCWGKTPSSQIFTFNTSDLDSEEMPDYNFLTLPVNSLKLSYIYAVEAVVEGISSEAVAYLENLKELSVPKADLFTPMPSMVRGNIRNSQNEEELIIGYINVGMETRMRHFIYASADHRYYRYPDAEVVMGTFSSEWNNLHLTGYMTIGGDDEMGYSWVLTRCADCRENGGTKNKPDFWPNDDI